MVSGRQAPSAAGHYNRYGRGTPNVPVALDSVDEIPSALGHLGEGIERGLRTRSDEPVASWSSTASGTALGCGGMRGVWLRAMLAEDRAFRDRLLARQGGGARSTRGRGAHGAACSLRDLAEIIRMEGDPTNITVKELGRANPAA
jgi:hypothetical protein